MALTYFLAQLLGYWCILAGLLFLARKKMLAAVIHEVYGSQTLLIVLGWIVTVLGLSMVLAHNIWNEGHLVLLVTVIGWLALLKGVALLFVPQQTMARWIAYCKLEKLAYLYAVILLLIGLYLLHGGITQTGLMG